MKANMKKNLRKDENRIVKIQKTNSETQPFENQLFENQLSENQAPQIRYAYRTQPIQIQGFCLQRAPRIFF